MIGHVLACNGHDYICIKYFLRKFNDKLARITIMNCDKDRHLITKVHQPTFSHVSMYWTGLICREGVINETCKKNSI